MGFEAMLIVYDVLFRAKGGVCWGEFFIIIEIVLSQCDSMIFAPVAAAREYTP